MSYFPETDVCSVVQSLNVPMESVTVVGGAALEIVVGPDVRRAADIDLAVTQEAYQYLREHGDMQERVVSDGSRRLYGNGFDVGVTWGNQTMDDLRANAFTHHGVTVTGLPDLYAHKQQRALPKDARDLALVKSRLYGERSLPAAMLTRELAFVQCAVPETLQNRPELQVAANGLYIVRTIFGHEDVSVRGFCGSAEPQLVPATYHAWKHSAHGTRDGQRNMDELERRQRVAGLPPLFDDVDRLAQAVGYANHDAVFGHGRRSINPNGHDELQSAELAVRHLEAVGVTNERLLAQTHAVVMATTYDEVKQSQDINPARGFVPAQEISTGSDLAGFRRHDGALNSMRLGVENLCRASAGYDRPLMRLIETLNRQLPRGAEPLRLTSTQQALELIDQHPTFAVLGPNGQRMTLREAFIRELRGSEKFMQDHRFPASWVAGDPALQVRNARRLGFVANALETSNDARVCLYYEEELAYAQAYAA